MDRCKRALRGNGKEKPLLIMLSPFGALIEMASGVEFELVPTEDPNENPVERLIAGRGTPEAPSLYPYMFRDNRFQKFIVRAYLQEMDRVVRQARSLHRAYSAGKRTDLRELCRHCLYLAQIDTIFRARFTDPWLGVADEKDVDDLVQLLGLLKRQPWLRNRHVVLLNPTFGEGSKLVDGADADLVLDDMLVDIKCTKQRIFRGEIFHQLLGYYILSRIAGTDGAPKGHRIRRLGVYFARHGELYEFPVESVLPEEKLPEVADWFKNAAERF